MDGLKRRNHSRSPVEGCDCKSDMILADHSRCQRGGGCRWFEGHSNSRMGRKFVAGCHMRTEGVNIGRIGTRWDAERRRFGDPNHTRYQGNQSSSPSHLDDVRLLLVLRKNEDQEPS